MACGSAFSGFGCQLRVFIASVALMESCFDRNCSFAVRDSCCTGGNVVPAGIFCAPSTCFAVFRSVRNKPDSSNLAAFPPFATACLELQRVAADLVDGGVLAGLEGLIQFWSPIPWFMCRQSKPGLHEARSHTRPFRAESPK